MILTITAIIPLNCINTLFRMEMRRVSCEAAIEFLNFRVTRIKVSVPPAHYVSITNTIKGNEV
jgi:hypothetical protein